MKQRVLLDRLSDTAESYLQEFQHNQVAPTKHHRSPKTIWKPLATGASKQIMMGTVFEESNKTSIGGVICNSQEEVLPVLS